MSKVLERIKEYTEKFKVYLDLFLKKTKPFLEKIRPFLKEVDRKLAKLILFIRINKIHGALLFLSCMGGLILILIVAVTQEWLFLLNSLMFLIKCFFLALLCMAILYFISKKFTKKISFFSKVNNLLFVKALVLDISNKESKADIKFLKEDLEMLKKLRIDKILKEDLELLKNMTIIADEWKNNRKKDNEPKIKM